MEREKLRNNENNYPYILVDRYTGIINPTTISMVVPVETYDPNIFIKAGLLFKHYKNKITARLT